jgi:hypothetical protein
MTAEPAPPPVAPAASLRAAVEAQAQALVAGDHARFASYMTPQALASLDVVRNLRSFTVLDVTQDGPTGRTEVRLAPANIVLRQRWQLGDGAWTVVRAEIARRRAPWWRRLFSRHP